MDTKTDPKRKSAKPAPKSRDERLKAALRANLQRRKAQARARHASDESDGKDE
ncbi:hypothetical protein [Celeribacter persicus]|jgi:hypothetical protein|uniref:Uncharacterized protein n=1 Tax=Celeribacter persicus TaxID=1651082 RepID=A0A2T5HVT1_9RHOB|nr:hypothetical protein [Celeribacter persicus]PTQ75703.1 hypothetical protein C8N42_101243 [Celeribacter persicus]